MNTADVKREGAATLGTDLDYGFRYDPVKWAESADTLAGAWVRTIVLKAPKEGDAAILQTECDRLLAPQSDDGRIGDNTEGALMRLLDLGCPLEKPEFRRALKAMHAKAGEDDGRFGVYALHVACRAGWAERDELKQATARLAEDVGKLNFWHACPWSGEVHLQALWAAREHADVLPALERGLTTMRDHLQDGRHWPIYLDPFGWLECMGYIDHPIAGEIVVRMIPMILRAQAPDGSWGGEEHLGYGPGNHTFIVLRALHKWGLIEPLREKPPLPPEWRVVKSVPAPGAKPRTMTWDGRLFWVYDKATGLAVSISPDDGRQQHAVKLPEPIGGIAWSSGELLATRVKPEAILVLDPRTGQVRKEIAGEVWGEFSALAELDERVCVGNVYCGGVHFLQDGKVNQHPRWLAGGFTVDMACVEGSVWHIDAFNQLLIRSDPNQAEHLVDWAGVPFVGDTAGLAWDGHNLWVLDDRYHRICMIERAAERRAPRAARVIRDDLRNYFNAGSGAYPAPGMTRELCEQWAAILDLPPAQRLAAMAEQAKRVGCTQSRLDDAVLWLNAEGGIDALFSVVDRDDIRGVKRFLELLEETGSPLAFIIIPCDGYHDVLSFQPDWYIRHNNQPRSPGLKPRAARPGVRDDLDSLDWLEHQANPADLYASTFADIARAHQALAADHGCTQTVDDDIMLWRDADGVLQAMFTVCQDTDLGRLRRLYARIEARDCPITWLVLRLSHWQEPVFDVLSLSREHYMRHRNRIGNWTQGVFR